MSAKRSIARFLMFREQYPDSYAIWHSRIATHGVRNESNCHPFRVGGSDITYLAHNGVLSVTQEKDDKRSDTRVFAEEVLPKLGGVCSLDDPTIFNMVSDWARGSKMAILTLDPNAEHQLYIINEKAGEWDKEGVWWSNKHHRPAKVYDWSSSSYYNSKPVQQTLTKIISYANNDTGYWEAPKSGIEVWRNWKSGDTYDIEAKEFHTPAPGTPITPPRTSDINYQTALSLVKDKDSLDNLESEEEDNGVLMECPQCRALTDLKLNEDYCIHCLLCFDCGTHYTQCMCYTPQSAFKGGWSGHFDF